MKKKAPKTPKPKQSDGPITKALRSALARYVAEGGTYYRISRDTGIAHDSLTRFGAGSRDLTTATADLLAQHLGLRIVEPDPSEITPEDVLPADSGD